MNGPTAAALGLYFLGMLAIGLYAFRTASSDVTGFMLGGRQLRPEVAALSAGASDMSGWMLMGLPGAVYLAGLEAAWIAVGLTIGAWANYRLVAPRLRLYTEQADNAVTVPDFLEKRFDDGSHSLRVIAALVIILFFTLYTSAGLVAGGKLFESAFGWDYRLGLAITAGVVLAYTLIGGFLAVSLTDFAQGCIMFVALLMVPGLTLLEMGGWGAAAARVSEAQPLYLSWVGGASGLAIVSAASWGLGYFGQPHIIVRFMAVRSLADIPAMRRIGMGWMVATLVGAVLTGIFGRALVLDGGIAALRDPETVFILLAQTLFHPFVAGFLLAAILAAIMSTISSQLLVAASSLTEDLYRIFLRRDAGEREAVLVGRIATLLVALVAGILALDRSSSILGLVGNAWAGFGAAFGPVILLALHWRGLSRAGALAGMVAGAGTVLAWLHAPFTLGGQPPSAVLYEIVPGVAAAFLAAVLVSRLAPPRERAVLAGFDRMETALAA